MMSYRFLCLNFGFIRAYASKLVWADRSFSDCIAIVNAYRMWKRHHHDGYFNKPLDSYKNLENEWCYHRFLQQKVHLARFSLLHTY